MARGLFRGRQQADPDGHRHVPARSVPALTDEWCLTSNWPTCLVPDIDLTYTSRVPAQVRGIFDPALLAWRPEGYPGRRPACLLTFWIDLPYQGFRCLDKAPGMERSCKVRDCRAVRHRLLAGRDRARETKAGVRTPLAGACGRRALDRADLVPGRRRRRTRQPGPLGHEPTWWHCGHPSGRHRARHAS